jgi:hypothetical protein
MEFRNTEQIWYTLLTLSLLFTYHVVCCLFSWRYNPSWLYFHSPVAGFSLLVFEVSWSHTTTRHNREDSSGRVINPSQRPLPDDTQHSQQINIYTPGGIRTYNLSRRAAANLRLRPRGHWEWHTYHEELQIREQEDYKSRLNNRVQTERPKCSENSAKVRC